MTTAIYEKLKKELKQELLQELSNLIGRDSKDHEGEYQAFFIKKILRRSRGRGPFYKFTDKKSFLPHVRSKK